ncbi:hypothetical protein D3C80_1481230 [compost metagenome]
MDQRRHPKGQGIDREHHCEIHRHQQPYLRVHEDGGKRRDRFVLFFLVQLLAQLLFLLRRQPLDRLEAVRQTFKYNESKQDDGQPLDDEHPLPAAQAAKIMKVFEDAA